MLPELFKYAVTAAFVILTFYLSWIGMRKTRDIKGFAIGNRDMSPYLVGITMAASISSTATFVINPGFVYVHGVSAYLHYGVAATLGMIAAFVLLSRGFRRIGAEGGALTIPDWIYRRYGSRSLSFFFALINLLSITFVVAILVGSGILMSTLFGISYELALSLTLLFVFSYVLMGGTYAHAYTNAFQGMIMMVVALALFFSGLKYFGGGAWSAIASVDDDYARAFNPGSNLYYDFFSVFVSGFLVTFALLLQPHILTKVLYLRNDRDVSRFIWTAALASVCFGLMLFIGFYARLAGLEVERQDLVAAEYIAHLFSGTAVGSYFMTLVLITLLAAGVSTLDGILVALSAMVVNDIYRPLAPGGAGDGKGLLLSRLVLVAIGIIAFLLALDPPELVGLFGQKGVYGLAAASLVPILCGVLVRREIPLWIVGGAAAIGLCGHLGLTLLLRMANPSVSAAWAILASLLFAAVSIGVLSQLGRLPIVGQSKGAPG